MRYLSVVDLALGRGGDPGHTRVLLPETLIFLQQPQYAQAGITSLTDYRAVYKADYDLAFSEDNGENFKFALRAVKPSRIQPKTPIVG